jgi:hypothetical protein
VPSQERRQLRKENSKYGTYSDLGKYLDEEKLYPSNLILDIGLLPKYPSEIGDKKGTHNAKTTSSLRGEINKAMGMSYAKTGTIRVDAFIRKMIIGILVL